MSACQRWFRASGGVSRGLVKDVRFRVAAVRLGAVARIRNVTFATGRLTRKNIFGLTLDPQFPYTSIAKMALDKYKI